MTEPTRTEHPNGSVEYRDESGWLHREDGPAVIHHDGFQAWYFRGRFHRVDGPAVIHPDGYQAWYRHDQRHRLDGPAITRPDGTTEWWVNGQPRFDLEQDTNKDD